MVRSGLINDFHPDGSIALPVNLDIFEGVQMNCYLDFCLIAHDNYSNIIEFPHLTYLIKYVNINKHQLKILFIIPFI